MKRICLVILFVLLAGIAVQAEESLSPQECVTAFLNVIVDQNKDLMSFVSVSQKKAIGVIKEANIDPATGVIIDTEKQLKIDALSKEQWHIIRDFNSINERIRELL